MRYDDFIDRFGQLPYSNFHHSKPPRDVSDIKSTLHTIRFAVAALCLGAFSTFADFETRRAEVLQLEADGNRDAALSQLAALAETAPTREDRSELLFRAALLAERMERQTLALELVERIPVAPVAAFARMQILFGRRERPAIWEAFADEAIENWPEQVDAAHFERLPPISPDTVSTAASVMGNAMRIRGMAAIWMPRQLNLDARATRDFERAADLIPPGYWGAVALAELAKLQRTRHDDPEAALRTLRRIRANGRYRWHQNSSTLTIAEILLEQDAPDEAMAALKSLPLETLQGGWPTQVLRVHGRVLEALGREAEALERYREALSRDDGSWPSLTQPERRDVEDRIARLRLAVGNMRALAADGETAYQVVLPDRYPDDQIERKLAETAALMQRAFAANGLTLPIAREAERDPERPGIFLGDTAFARAQGVDLEALEGWAYVHKWAGDDLIIAGRDFSLPIPPDTSDARRRRFGARLGTTKGVTDFLYRYAGVRFLSPYGDTGIDFGYAPVIAAPADLDAVIEPTLRSFFELYFGAFGAQVLDQVGFYMIANNYLPNTDFMFTAHSYYRAVPRETYGESNPEFFALIGGERHMGPGREQYCISNPGFQERVYQDMLDYLDLGYDTTHVSHQDGFLACQCEACYALYETGGDWGEKIWLFHRELAERLMEDRPGKTVYIICYGPTGVPPKTFSRFPENTGVMICQIGPDFLARWKDYDVPQGFISYQYLFGFYNPLAYLPHQSPGRVTRLARKLYDFGVKGIFMDGFGHSFGLEGPTYYVYGRLFDDPHQVSPAELLAEYYQSAFAQAAAPMARFFDILHHALQFHGDMPRQYTDPSGRPRRYLRDIQDRMRLIRFLYPPSVLADLESHLSQAEGMGERLSEAVRARIALVRVEFEHLRHLANVSNHDLGYRLQPDRHSRDRLLDAVAGWQDYYRTLAADLRDREREAVPGWPEHRPFHGHGPAARWAEAPFNWDVEAMREAPLADALTLAALPLDAPPSLHDARWAETPAGRFQLPAGDRGNLTVSTEVRARYDSEALYLRFESELPSALTDFDPVPADGDTGAVEALETLLDPFGARERFYRLVAGPAPGSRFDAQRGFIPDPVHPLFGRDDPSWRGDWTVASERDGDRWIALLTIPYATLAVDAPEEGTVWYGNFGRTHVTASGEGERSLWSPARQLDETDAFGQIVFSDAAGLVGVPRHPVRELRERLYAQLFEIPDAWQKLENPLPLTEPWAFQADPMDVGVGERWFVADAGGQWDPIAVPAFWAETAVGDHLGHGWYRTRFKVPTEVEGRAVRLLFAGVDEQAWVYVNGEPVGEHTPASENLRTEDLWDRPFTVEVPAARLKVGDWNQLVVRVYASMGNAGIWRPVLAEIR